MFKSLKALSIQIEDENVKIVEGAFNGDFIKINKFIEIGLHKGLVDKGQIKDIEAISKEIKARLGQEKIKLKNVIYTVSSRSVISRILTLPSLKEKDIEKILRFELSQHFPVDLKNYIVESRVVEKLAHTNTSICVSSALPKNTVDQYLLLSSHLNLRPKALDLKSNALAKLIFEESRIDGSLNRLSKATIAVLDLESSYSQIVIIKNGYFFIDRLMEYGRDHLADEKKLGLLTYEIKKLFKYYLSRNDENSIARLYLTNKTDFTADEINYLKEHLKVAIYFIGDLTSVEVESKENIELNELTFCLGSLIRR